MPDGSLVEETSFIAGEHVPDRIHGVPQGISTWVTVLVQQKHQAFELQVLS